jgi:hypothetical protein
VEREFEGGIKLRSCGRALERGIAGPCAGACKRGQANIKLIPDSLGTAAAQIAAAADKTGKSDTTTTNNSFYGPSSKTIKTTRVRITHTRPIKEFSVEIPL